MSEDAAAILRREKARADRSKLVNQFLVMVRLAQLPTPVLEHRFHATRRWRFDVAWPEHRVAVELQGGVHAGGRHTRGAGYINDCDKLNAAQVAGWRLIYLTGDHLEKRGLECLTPLQILLPIPKGD